jgi:predicted DNA-binding transcriptional regulator AlpA
METKAANINRKKLVDVKYLSEFLSIKASTIYQWAELGQIPCIKLNGCLRFDMDEINKWLDSCKKDHVSDYNPILRLEARRGG